MASVGAGRGRRGGTCQLHCSRQQQRRASAAAPLPWRPAPLRSAQLSGTLASVPEVVTRAAVDVCDCLRLGVAVTAGIAFCSSLDGPRASGRLYRISCNACGSVRCSAGPLDLFLFGRGAFKACYRVSCKNQAKLSRRPSTLPHGACVERFNYWYNVTRPKKPVYNTFRRPRHVVKPCCYACCCLACCARAFSMSCDQSKQKKVFIQWTNDTKCIFVVVKKARAGASS